MRILLALSVLTLALAGCSGNGGGDGGYETPPQDDQGRYVIEMGGDHGNRFSPERAEVPVGATVVWQNLGGQHNVDFESGDLPSSEIGGEGLNHEVTFDEAGTFDYHCDPHESLGMVGTLRVVEEGA